MRLSESGQEGPFGARPTGTRRGMSHWRSQHGTYKLCWAFTIFGSSSYRDEHLPRARHRIYRGAQHAARLEGRCHRSTRDWRRRADSRQRGSRLARRNSEGTGAEFDRRSISLSTRFRQGFVTNVLNPKVALFFLAFLPQFVDADAPSKILAFLCLGLLFDFNGTLWSLFVAWLSARAASAVRRRRVLHRRIDQAVGSLFIYLGIKLAAAER
jgi:hypothetical protein